MKTHLMKLTAFVAMMLSCATAMAGVGQYPSLAKGLVKGVADSLSITNTSIAFGEKVLLHDMDISIAALDSTAVPELDYGMFNVSVEGEGYRFLPHGTHFDGEGATVRLKYDRTRIPSGYTEDDIRTYYFDPDRKCWVALPRVEVDKQSACVVSRTTHFTDMINGVIVAPESPETSAFTPTMMNDIKAADPASKINIIMPPTANNRGSANLTYPFEMPPARNGMQPQIALSYNSDGGSGWAGEGWDISISTICVDTRWGVPRYNPDFETETYLLNGQMLAMMDADTMTVAHRKSSVDRQLNRQFFLRQGGDFSKIIRVGDSPSNYHWEITDRNGVVYTYGGKPDAVLKGTFTDIEGQTHDVIAEWKLTRVQETHGDYINYYYSNVEEQVVPGLSAKANYLSRIEAGSAGQDTAHTIVYFFPNNLDKTIKKNNARYGFLASSNRLLGRVEVHYQEELLRSYIFDYNNDTTFHKDQLKRIAHLDNNNQEVAFQEFDYYDDVLYNGSYVPFENNSEAIKVPNDMLDADFINPLDSFGDFSDRATALGGNKSKNFSTSFYAGIGKFDGDVTSKSNTYGFSFSYSKSESTGVSALIDLDGDGKLDKVFVDNDGIKYRPGITSESILVSTVLNDFSKTKSQTVSGGLKGHPSKWGFTAAIGKEYISNTAKTETYFSDVNADGLVDIVSKGKVYFNTTKYENGVLTPSFSLYSSDTPSPIINTGNIDSSDTEVSENDIQEAIANSPMEDMVRVWLAPQDGRINVYSTIALLQPSNNDDLDEADGVYASIQHNGIVLWQDSIGINDTIQANVSDLTIAKGDRLYFRLQSGYSLMSDGACDSVYWNPVITYVNLPDITTPNGHKAYTFNSLESEVVSTEMSMPISGTSGFRVTGSFTKPQTSDDITLRVYVSNEQYDTLGNVNPSRYRRLVCDTTFLYSQSYTGNLSLPFNVINSDKYVECEMYSSTNVAWEKVKWMPVIQSDSDSIALGVKCSVYADIIKRGTTKLFNSSDSIIVTFQQVVAPNATGTLTMAIKSKNKLYYKNNVVLYHGTLTNISPISFTTTGNDSIWVELYSEDAVLANSITRFRLSLQSTLDGLSKIIDASIFTSTEEDRFGSLYRGWGQFVYNTGANCRYENPINESILEIPNDTTVTVDIRTWPFSVAVPDLRTQSQWYGPNHDIYINGLSMGTSRLGEKNVDLKNPLANLDNVAVIEGDKWRGSTARGITLISRSVSRDSLLSADGSFGRWGASASINLAEGESENLTSFMDMNGDGYPDIITKNLIQYTNTKGGFDEEKLNGAGVNKGINSSVQIGAGGSAQGSYTFSKKNGIHISFAKLNEASSQNAKNGKINFQFDANYNKNDDFTDVCFVDINGDGLPDKVSHEGTVCLNFGYSFSQPLNWGIDAIQNTHSWSVNAGAGVSLPFSIDKKASSISAGIGVSTMRTNGEYDIFDVNGDGLPDRIKNDNGTDYVALNIGNGFSNWTLWNNGSSISNLVSTSESANAAFSIVFPIPTVPTPKIKIAINPGIYDGHSMARPHYELQDIDGDGFLDVLESDRETELRVKRSTIARTNKLKTVTNSLGGKFTVDYEHSSPTYGLPGGKWVMSSVDVDYGIDYNDYKIPNTKTIYEYGHGVRDRHEREFLGFGEVVSKQYYNRPNDQRLFRQTVEEYDTASIYTAGSLLSTRVENSAGDIMTKTENEYYMFGIKNSNSNNYGGTYRFDTTFVCWNDRGAAYAPIKYSQNRQYERTDTGTVMSESWYQYYVSPGDHGLLRNYKYSNKGGLGCSGNGAFDYRTNISYHSNLDENHHIFGLPLRVKVYESPSRLRHSIKASYSDAANPTRITGIVRLLGYASTHGEHQEGLNGLDDGTATTNGFVGPGDGVVGPNHPGVTGPDQEPDLEPQYVKIEASTTYKYDSYGNIETVTLPSNGYGQNLTDSCWYDTQMRMYPVKVSDSYGYESTSDGIDYRYGITRQMHDIHKMDYYTYSDNLGRVIGYNSPIEISQIRTGSGDVNNPPYYTVKYEYEPKAIIANNGKISRPAYAITWNLNKRNGSNADYIKTITFVDGFGRPIQVQKESIIQNAAGDGTEHVLIVSGQQIFDEFGRVEKSYYPTTVPYTDNIAFSDLKDSVDPTVTTYDVLDRLDYVELPNGKDQYYMYAIGDHTVVSQFYDENEHLSETYTDGSGRTVKSVQYKDEDNSQPLTTSFEYDGIGRLVKVTDTEGNETLSQYDMGDRRVSVTHPASGKTTFTYAPNGSLLTKKTANMQGKDKEIRYKYNYDQLDSIFYPDHPENNVVYHYGNRSDNGQLKGRVKLRIDATGAVEYDYGMLGEVTKERRTVIVPNHEISTFVTQWVYDSHNRLKQMTYPDGTLVNYGYDDAGQLNSVSGTRDVEEYDYVSDIRYDKFGDRVYMQYGNGAVTTYQYTSQMRRLRYLTVKGLYGNDTIRTAFTYDPVGNIKSVNRSMRISGTTGMLNGTVTHTYQYDPLYRLIRAVGHFGGDQANYSLDMSYDDMYRITSKKQDLSQSDIQFEGTLFSGYDLDYAYNTTPGKRFQMVSVGDVNYRTDEEPTEDDAVVEKHCYEYDNNGNIIYVNTSRTMPDVGFQSDDVEKMREERFRWDEENRLLAISQNGYVSQYWYDADGERVVKEHGANQAVFVNSEHNGTVTQTDRYSVYPNGYYSYGDAGRYTKHIYIGAERIASQVGGKPYPSPNTESVSVAGRSNGIDIRVDYSGKLDQHLAQIDSVYDAFDLPYNGTNHDSYYNNYFFDRPGYWDNTEGLTLNSGEPEMPRSILDRDLLYYYHRDHLGSSTAVSNDDGKLSQQIEYLPYGEVFLEKQMASSDYHSPYKFNGKELDEETGLYYYGARYMNPRLSIWYGTDKLQEKCPHTSSYSICLSNPVRYWDITGMAPEDNPESSSPLEDYAKAVVNGIYYCSSFYDENNNGERDAKQVIYGYYNDLLQGQVTDTDISSADKYNMYVTMDRIFHVYESDANEYNNYEAHMVALLMTGFVTGTGPENYDFPENGIISSKFLNSAILKSALEDYNNGIIVNNTQYSFGLNVISNIIENQTPYNIVGLAGSAKITIEPEQNNMLKVTIFNITSLTSGAYGKEIGPNEVLYPKSYMRVSGQRTPYGNISQTYHLLIENKR